MRLTLSIILFFYLSKGFAQDFELRITPFIESKIVYKDSTSEEGLLRLASSIFKLRLKKTKKDKERKIDYKKVERIITNPNTENERVFQYLNHNYNKFKIFAELIYSDVLSIYVSSSDDDDLFYSDFNRQTLFELMSQARFTDNTDFMNRLKKADTIELPNGKKLPLPIRYTYYYGVAFGASPTINYYLLKEGSNKLLRVEKAKRFIKKSQDVFDNCPELIDDLNQKKVTLGDLPTFIEYYKVKCMKRTVEKE